MIDFWIFPLSTIWGAYQTAFFLAFFNISWHPVLPSGIFYFRK